MNFFNYFRGKFEHILKHLLEKNNIAFDPKMLGFAVETPKDERHGDIATNMAMVLNKYFSKSPMELAEIFKEEILKLEEVESVEVAKPAFINIRVKNTFWQESLKEALSNGLNYGRITEPQKEVVNVEYVSANPTGPLHIGHGRGAVVGSVLAQLYKYLGYEVLEEYYVNDAGNQVNVLGKSLYYRYLELLDSTHLFQKEAEFYPGDYLITAAKELIAKEGDIWLKKPLEETLIYMKDYAITAMLALIKEDLALIEVKHDVFISEREVATDKAYNETLEELQAKDLLYVGTLNPPKGKQIDDFEPRAQKLFRSTVFGDDSDRPLEKSNGERTYFANDVVNHNNKVKRGYTKLVTILGADHIGYIKRVEASVTALSDGKAKMLVVCCQLVNLLDNGSPIRMSKRAGNFVTLKDLVTEVGKDIFRFMMITRKNDVTIDFDLAKTKEQTADNPLYYIQYAYARVCSVIKAAKEDFPNISEDSFKNADLSLLGGEYEIALIKSILKLPKTLEGAAISNDPHRLYLYLLEVSQNFHGLWSKGNVDSSLRFIIKNNENLTIARLSLLKSLANAIAVVTGILGVHIRENM